MASAGYVALGDSFASGPLIPWQSAWPPNCLRSTHNYPGELSRRLGVSLEDRSCAGATTRNMSSWQGLNPPQLLALGSATRLVTLTIGANDVRLFDDVLQCIRLLPMSPCRDRFVHDGIDTVHEAIVDAAPRIAATLSAIRGRSPEARVVVVGYGNYIQPGGCFPVQPILPQDADYLAARMHELDLVLARAAEVRRMEYVDLETAGVGHDTCAPPDARWIEGLVPLMPAAPLHPNAHGMTRFAAIIESRL